MQEAGNFHALCQIFAHCAKFLRTVRNFLSWAKFRALQEFSRMREIYLLCEILCFLFSAQNDFVLLIFLFFSLDVILLTWVFLVFHFIARLYIAILYTVDLTNHEIEENTGALFLLSVVSLFFSPFLSLSRQPNTPLRMKTQGMLG